MEEIGNMLQRMRTLAQQSLNGTTSINDRGALQKEFDELKSEIARIAEDTTFGGQKLLNGGYSGAFQVGADAGQTINFDINNSFNLYQMAFVTTGHATISYNAADGTYTVNHLNGPGVPAYLSSIQSKPASLLAMANLDYYIEVVDSKRAELGAVQNRFDSVIRNQANVSENVNSARSRIRDADFAVETANLTKQNILQQAASSILSQANKRPQSALSLLQS